MASGTADERGSKSPKRKLIFLLHLKIGIKCGFFVCNKGCKDKVFLYCFCSFAVFCKALNVCREGRQNCNIKFKNVPAWKMRLNCRKECNVGMRLKPWPVYKAVLRHKE